MVEPKTAAKIDAAIAKAVEEAERKAGIAATLKHATTAAEAEEMQAAFAEGEEPSPEMIEEGLDLPQFAHWKAIRDDLLDYSPTTLKLVQDLIRSDFRGTRFVQIEKKADTRINLVELAKQPEAEVRRVLDNYVENVRLVMGQAEATPETEQRIGDMIMAQVTDQLEQARKRVRDPMFVESVVSAEPGLTPEQKAERIKFLREQSVQKLVNAGLFRDERLNLDEMVKRVAEKSRIRKLLPNVPELVKQVFETPFYRQAELSQRFADALVTRLGITPEQAQQAAKVFEQAFATKFAAAKAKALKQAQESLTPKERQLYGQKRPIWRRIERAVNAGLFDPGTILQELAAKNGWKIPTEAQKQKMRDLSAEEQRLRELTPAETAAAGTTPEAVEQARQIKQAATEEKRIKVKKQMEVIYAQMTRPISGRHPIAMKRNNAEAINELTSANMLLKIGFAPRQLISVLTQGAVHTPTRAIGEVLVRRDIARGKDEAFAFWTEAGQALSQAYKARFAAFRSALDATRAAFLGRGEARNVDRLMSGIAAVDRIIAQADEMAAKGKPAQAFLLRTFSFIRLGYRVAQALDNLHGLPAEYQDMYAKVVTELRRNGKTAAEAQMSADWVMGDMNSEWQRAIVDVQNIWDANGITGTPAEVRESAWQVVKRRQYQRIAELGLLADDFEESNRLLRDTVGWNVREVTGLGGVVGTTMSRATSLAASAGVPLPIARFGNAIAITINRGLMFTPAFKLAELGGPKGAISPWFFSETDKAQRKIEAIVGSTIGIAMFMLAMSGALVVRLRWPKDEEEKQLWEREGHKPWTAEVQLGDGSFIPVSLNTGPLQFVAPYLAAGGALRDALVNVQKQQARLDAEAARKGLPPGKARGLSLADLAGVAASAGYAALMGGRTASGLLGSLSDYGTFNVVKAAASQVSPLLPGVPGLQEISRMGGVVLDSRLAGFWDFVLPLPTSSARKVNMLGDPAGNPDAVQRILQILTGGTFPGVVRPQDAHEVQSYRVLFASGYRPPSIDPNKGYAINGEVRPLTNEELSRYTDLRGQYFKDGLAFLPDDATPKQVQAVFKEANTKALAAVGVDTGAQNVPTASTAVGSRPQTPGATNLRTAGPTARLSRPGGISAGGNRPGANLPSLRRGVPSSSFRLPSMPGTRALRRSLRSRARLGGLRRSMANLRPGRAIRGLRPRRPSFRR